MSDRGICELLTWDTECFGLRVGRLTRSRLTPDDLHEALRWCDQERIGCLYCLVDPDDAQTIRLAEEAGFYCVDRRLTMVSDPGGVRPVEQGASEMEIRPAKSGDIPRLREIAAESHTSTRFFVDPGFTSDQAGELYRRWIEQSCCGYADLVLVADGQGEPVGYLTGHLEGEAAGRIGLVGVASKVRGQGIGHRLLLAGLEWFRAQGVARLAVVTQARNLAAQQLYRRHGFVVQSAELWYHKWF